MFKRVFFSKESLKKPALPAMSIFTQERKAAFANSPPIGKGRSEGFYLPGGSYVL